VTDEASQIAAALAEAARRINAPDNVSSTLKTIVEVARDSMPDVDHVGISITHRRGKIETMAATDPLVYELDRVQYELREGPCVQAIETDPVIVVNNLRHDQRWPRYIPRAVEQGVRSQLGLRLYVEKETLGGINVYSTSSDEISEETQHLAELFAAHAALALGRIRREEDLNTALASRKLIGQAIGIVMERYQMDEDRAFGYLARVSQHGNVKLRDVARELVEQRNRRTDGDAGRESGA
jgi:GAF domain-containing protein